MNKTSPYIENILNNKKGVSSWSAVLAMSLGAFALVSSEFMPVSLLTPVAKALQISEGQAGQAISISGVFAVLTSLLMPSFTKGFNRKSLLLGLTAMMIFSGLVVSFAPNYLIFMVGRALIGVVIGGFWSMSVAIAMRLVEKHHVPRALAIFNGGNALATVVAAPAGSFLGGLIGWRGAFFCIIPIALAVFIWLIFSLPSLPDENKAERGTVLSILKYPVVATGMMAVSLFFMGQFTLFTYVRPFLETITHTDISTLSLILLMMGLAGFIGTILIGTFLKRGTYPILIGTPLFMSVLAILLILFGKSAFFAAAILMLWGFFATSAPVGWWTWLAQTLPQKAEVGGGLMVAVIQLAITLGATCGGVIFDTKGYQATFITSAFILVIASLFAFLTAGIRRKDKAASMKP
ncbi:putative arabinose efflux permease MFS family AraJ [Zymomonas mobilis subsp. mobilis ZM4 = ATCC 31821]|uniref:Major facilitator superfamily MFS_1 n=1 Tax=Zymomonas mobilis subsp. mobilis (strain ATCC 31821 / ZM4 / CP4) TaxID=264203 RepID=Q5NM59_ZYMMO|nr:MFS transporter [Zymomonas mobilis]AAV90201.1 major facilitator superfamily MFS_1 [Zymomonas mobilis subsp. mobilis ZM4 = ATCC 31821]AVZ26406.1 putative arabinose efflux permease MFS family AraJ [Zymomonas mobilis subsp. mobilis]AVZ28293.1 putative arabinose efflux permease MFS family AraJ [Zymomonas mobilis subsp. mobilis]AVZ42738.1 putative arabinose efflux permease MFS family AraJ [Zymomonas mobilis subsp. mobilis ZM4 = ATCC 31821]UBQ07500.1 MFS transporter [Zymomonas mobilis]